MIFERTKCYVTFKENFVWNAPVNVHNGTDLHIMHTRIF